jgi:transcriptional repressor NrdR
MSNEVIDLKCPFCGFPESKVVDSRPSEEGTKIRRRRECLSCSKRFTTYETMETLPFMVIKKDKSREVFDKTKLLNGLLRACEKRPVSIETLEQVVNDIESSLLNSLEREVSTVKIGELVLEHLRKIDEVAYVRFASVYRQFADVESFMEELKRLRERK